MIQILIKLTFIVTLLQTISLTCTQSPTSTSPDRRTNSSSCNPSSALSCRDTVDSISISTLFDPIKYDTFRTVTNWDPSTRHYSVLHFINNNLIAGNSFVHVYNKRLQDSILYWIDYAYDSIISYSGYGIYHYDSNSKLTRIDNYNSSETVPYGYSKYSPTGKRIAFMQDGYVEEYNDQGKTTKLYYENSKDTTLYSYDSDNSIKEKKLISNNILRFQEIYVGTIATKSKSFDSTGTLSEENDLDSVGRATLRYYYTDNRIDSTITFTYHNSNSYQPAQKRITDKLGIHISTITYDLSGNITKQLLGTNSTEQECLKPFSKDSCYTAP